MPTKNKKATTPGRPASGNLTLRVPKEMAVPGICRGAVTGWPQLVEAMNAVSEDPEFLNSFRQTLGAGQLGGPQALLASLITGPALLINAAPPADLYARFVWLTARVYQAARSISVTLKHLPGLFTAAQKSAPAEIGALTREVLSGPGGLSSTAGNVASWAAGFLADFPNVGTDLEAARRAHHAATVAVEKQTGGSEDKDVVGSIRTHAVAAASADAARSQLRILEATAGKVTAFAVVANMTMAVQSLEVAWKVTKDELEAVAQSDLGDLGQLSFFRERFGLDEAIGEWGSFAGIVKSFIQRLLIAR